MIERTVTYSGAGAEMTGLIVDGSGGRPAPGVLVAHEAPGRDPRMLTWAQRLASRGYVAMAMDLYGAPFSLEESQSRHESMMETPGLMLARAQAALEALAAQPNVDRERLAAIGFCQGGVVATELARAAAPIRAAIGFHAGLKRPEGSVDGPIEAKLLMMIGAIDPVVPPEDRRAFAAEMEDKKADWQLHVFGGVGHTFTNPAIDALGIPGFGYNATAEKRAWTMALGLLDEVFVSNGDEIDVVASYDPTQNAD